MPAGRCSQDDLNTAIILIRMHGDSPSGFTRLCCLHMSLKMFEGRVRAMAFCSVAG